MKMTIDIIMDRVREKEGPNQQIWQHLLSATGGRYRSIRATREAPLLPIYLRHLYAFLLKNIEYTPQEPRLYVPLIQAIVVSVHICNSFHLFLL